MKKQNSLLSEIRRVKAKIKAQEAKVAKAAKPWSEALSERSRMDSEASAAMDKAIKPVFFGLFSRVDRDQLNYAVGAAVASYHYWETKVLPAYRTYFDLKDGLCALEEELDRLVGSI